MPPSRLKPIRRPAAIGLAALCGCQPAPAIMVGFIGDLSARVSELAVETLNAHAGQRFELRLHDNAHADAQASDAIDAAADEGDAFAVGPMTSVEAQTLVTEAMRRHLVLISPSAKSDDLRGIDDYFFRIVRSAGQGAEQLAQIATARGLSSAAIMVDGRNLAYSKAFARTFSIRKRFIAHFGNDPSQAAVFSYEAVMVGATGLLHKADEQSLRAPGQCPGLQQPIVFDRFGDSTRRFRLSVVRDGRFAMLPA